MEDPITINQVYAPESSYSEDVVEEFYDMLQSKIDAIPNQQTYMVMGDSIPKQDETNNRCGKRQLVSTDLARQTVWACNCYSSVQ